MEVSKTYSGIYLIASPSEKVYIGQSRNVYKRFKQYKNLHCKDQPRIYNSLKKHGVENHTFQPVYYISPDSPQEVFDFRERQIIKLIKDDGYESLNLTIGGDGCRGRIVTAEQKQHLSEIKKGKMKGKENPFYGKKHTDETRKILSESRKGIKLTEDHKNKLLSSRRGKPAWNSGIKYTDEQKSKLPKTWLGRSHSTDTISKMRKASKSKKGCLQYDLNGIFIKKWECIGDAARHYNIPRSNISLCCRGKLTKSHGFKWIFA